MFSQKTEFIERTDNDLVDKKHSRQNSRLFGCPSDQVKVRSKSPEFTQSKSFDPQHHLEETRNLISKLRSSLNELTPQILVKNKDLAVELSVLQYLIESKLNKI